MKPITAAMLSTAALILAACGGADTDVADAAEELQGATTDAVVEMADEAMDNAPSLGGSIVEFTRADYMEACTTGGAMTTQQCECTLDFYETNGISISDMNDEAKLTEFLQGLPMEKSMEMAKCMTG